MRKLFLFLMAILPCFGQTPSISNLSFDNVTSSSWRLYYTPSVSFSASREAITDSSHDCTQPNGAGNPVSYDAVPGGGGGAQQSSFISTGKASTTTYKVCAQIQVGGNWYSSAPVLIKTLDKPGGGFIATKRAQKVNTDYPSDIINNIAVDSYTATCATFHDVFGQALGNLLTRNAVITLPVGSANTCYGTISLDQDPPDVSMVLDNYVSSATHRIMLTTWQDGTNITEGQAVVFGRSVDYSAELPGGILLDGRLYYVHDPQPSGFQVTAFKTFAAGGPIVQITRTGDGNNSRYFRMAPYPRHLKNLIIRTATPDNQFTAPGTRTNASWIPKMAWLTNPSSNRGFNGAPTLRFGQADGRFQSLLANIRMVGIAFTVQETAANHTAADPTPFAYDLILPPTTQNIILDRCAFFAPDLMERHYSLLGFQGINNAVVHSYFDPTEAYFHSRNTAGVIAAGNSQFSVGAGVFTTGAYQSVTSQSIVATLTGTPTAGAARRFTIGFPLSNSNTLQVYVPTGVSGSCTGGTCQFNTLNASAGGSCDVDTPSEWPLNTEGKVSVKMVGCGDISASGIISNVTGAYAAYSPGTYNGGLEGIQAMQGDCGPGPLTWRDNEQTTSGNWFHMADGCGSEEYKHDYWMYRNDYRPQWRGMTGSVDDTGNTFGSRSHINEFKVGDTITWEGNFVHGSYIDNTSQVHNGYVFVTRALNKYGAQNAVVADNIFEHVAGLLQLNELNQSALGNTTGANGTFNLPGSGITIENNILWDMNQMGPDANGLQYLQPDGCSTQCMGPGVGTYTANNNPSFNASGQGWLFQGQPFAGYIVVRNNTFPDLRGRVPTLDYASDALHGPLWMVDNFLSINNTSGNYSQGYGARVGAGYPAGCSGSGYNLLMCAYVPSIIKGNVMLSAFNTSSQITGDGWGATNTVPAGDGSDSVYTSIWPNYVVKDWHYDIDPEMYRLPAGSPYAGKGADITRLKQKMGWIDNPTAWFDSANNLYISFLSHDENNQACSVDVAAPGQLYGTFTRFEGFDTASSKQRAFAIPHANFAAATTYQIRINCETRQPVLSVKSN